MKKSKEIILLNKNHSIDAASIKNLRDVDIKNLDAVMLPLQHHADLNEFLVIKAKNFIYYFDKCKITYQLRIEYTVEGETENPDILPEIEVHPKNVIELYQTLHILDDIRYLFTLMNSEEMIDEYLVIDMHSISISISGSNKGTIKKSFILDDDEMRGNRFLYADVLVSRLKPIYDLFTNDFGHNERLCFSNHKWYRTNSINDESIYGIKMYYNSIMLTDETTYKTVKKLFYHSANNFCYIKVYEKKSPCGLYYKTGAINSMYEDDILDGLISEFSYKLYSPEDILNILLYSSKINNALLLLGSCSKFLSGMDIGTTLILNFGYDDKLCNYNFNTALSAYGEIIIPINLDKIEPNLTVRVLKDYMRQENLIYQGRTHDELY